MRRCPGRVVRRFVPVGTNRHCPVMATPYNPKKNDRSFSDFFLVPPAHQQGQTAFPL